VLLGTLIALTTLNQNSEVVAMKAAGMSAHQVLAPMILASLLVAGVAFAFNETVVVRASRTAEAWSGADYKPIPPDTGVLNNVWALDGQRLVHVRLVVGRGDTARLEGVTIYQREGGAIAGLIDAQVARQRPGGWRLFDVRMYDTDMNVVRKQATMDTMEGVEPTRFTLARINATSENFASLNQAIADLDRASRPTAAARSGWWHKMSGPMSVVLMPLLAGLAAFGLARSGQVLVRAAIGMALGFTYFLVDNLSLALGNVGAYPPVLAAWAPFLLFLFIGEMVLVRSEE
jgi:lipopolysaccharide export system permease protein